MTTHPQRLLAYALIALGAFLLLLRLGGADWLWLALLGGVFLFGYSARRTYGFLVAGGVLLGLAVGTLLDSSAGLLLSLAAGFYAVDRVEPKPNRWALYSAGIFAALGVFVALGSFRLLNSVFFALVLVAVGVWLLLRGEGKVQSGRDVAGSRPDAPNYRSPPPTPNPPATATSVTSGPAAPAVPTPNPTATSSPAVRASNGSSSPAGSPSYNAPYGPSDVPPPPVVAGAETPQAVVSTAPPPPAPLSEAAQRRLERLSAWRRETAAAEGTPAYIVFSNDTLAKIAAAEPRTVEDLSQVRGVGPVKLSRYGEAVLRVLHEQV